MSIKELRLSSDEAKYAPLDLWSKRLGIPLPTLLHHASQGLLPVFFVPYVHGNRIRYVDTTQIDQQQYEVAQPPPVPESSLLGDVSYPGQLVGICLDSVSCGQLARGERIYMPFIAKAILRGDYGLNYIGCEQNHFGRTLSPNTRIAVFADQAHAPYVLTSRGPKLPVSRWLPEEVWGRSLEEHLRTPASNFIQPQTVFARDVDICRFVRDLTEYKFIAEIFDGKSIIKDLPPYMSTKLREIINAHRLFWHDSEDLSKISKEERRSKLTTHLRGAFKHICREGSKSGLLAKSGATVCHPFSKSGEQLLEETLVTPHMLALLTASKLYWLPHHNDSGRYETRPPSEALIHFLQFMGLTKLNEGRAGATLIEPEAAWEKESDEQDESPDINWPTTGGLLRPAL